MKSLQFAQAARTLCGLFLLTLTPTRSDAQSPPQYTVVDLGSFDPVYWQTTAAGVNNAGQVTGYSNVPTGWYHAFLYSDRVLTDLGTLNGGAYSIGDDINDSGQITGSSVVGTGIGVPYHAFLYSGGVMTDLGTLGGSDVDSIGRGINNGGQITGFSAISGDTGHAFLYSSGSMIDLGTLGGPDSEGLGINNASQVTGYSLTVTYATHAFLYSGGSMSDLGTLAGDTDSIGIGINDAGQITGYSYGAAGTAASHAFLYSGGTMIDLGTLGGTFSQGGSINNLGQVTGTSSTSNGSSSAFLYSGGHMYDLNSLIPANSGWVLESGIINDAGQICGRGNGVHAFLATPCTGQVTVASKPSNSAEITVKNGAARLLIEGLGPSLGKDGAVPDPVLEVYDATGMNIQATNNNWQDTQGSEIIATGHDTLDKLGADDSAVILESVQPGSYTVIEEGNYGNTGFGAIRVYDLCSSTPDTPVGPDIPTTTGIDTDLDALPDAWETSGVTVTPDGVCYPGKVEPINDANNAFMDLHAMGASPTHKDIFVHADWMLPAPGAVRVFKPDTSSIQKVVGAFAMAPIANVDGYLGINLHIDLGPLSLMTGKKTWADLSKAQPVTYNSPVTVWPPDNSSDFNTDLETTFKPQAFYPARRQYVFHYALFCDKLDAPAGTTGQAPIGGSDLIIALGGSELLDPAKNGKTRADLVQANAFMHELGHNLGLHHGGPDVPTNTDNLELNNKPNYLSVMNYLFLVDGIRRCTDSDCKNGTQTVDYATDALPPLNEFALDEHVGISAPSGVITSWVTLDKKAHFSLVPAVNWNLSTDPEIDAGTVTANINADVDSNNIEIFQTKLTGFSDWFSPLVYAGRPLGILMPRAVRALTTVMIPNEPNIDELAALTPQEVVDAEAVSPEDVINASTDEGEAPLAVHFDGTASTAVTGTIASWSWDFGDGSTGLGAVVDHTYTYPGDYFVYLNLLDSQGHNNVAPLAQRIHVTGEGKAPAKLANISTRMAIGTDENVLIGGFIVTGSQRKTVMIRAIGPSLPLSGSVADPVLELHNSAGTLIEINDNWIDSPEKQAIVDSAIPPTNDSECAIVASLPGNNSAYTAIVRGLNNTTGIGLVEVYDLSANVPSKLANISTRGFVQAGDNVMIGGIIVTPTTAPATKVLIRGLGPSLANSVASPLQDPTLELHDGNGAVIASNDDWKDTQQAEIEATTIPPTEDAESAIVATVAPGAYTAIVRGANDSTGVALVEAYQLGD